MEDIASRVGGGCGGEIHPLEGCATCRRRKGDLPWRELRTIGELGVMSTPWPLRVLESAIGFMLLAGSAALWTVAGQTWHRVAAVALGLIAVGLVYHALFTRAAIVIDVPNRAFIESRRALFQARDDRVRSFAEIAFVGLDYFHDRTFEDGTIKSEVLRANVWLEWTDGGFRSFGSGLPADAASLAERLHRLIEAPVRTTRAEESRTRDDWTLSSSE